jgi:formylglycine-generating enzyme required for sulfatase activity
MILRSGGVGGPGQLATPTGRGALLRELDHYPVVHVSWKTRLQRRWAGKRLPTEAEWEFAARGGRNRSFIRGENTPVHVGKPKINSWDGHFPDRNTGKMVIRDCSCKTICPKWIRSYDMGGNVWEWCSDWYRADYYSDCAQQQNYR